MSEKVGQARLNGRTCSVGQAYLKYLKAREKSLADLRKLFSDYLERKKYSQEIFGFIERDLGEAGFYKIWE